MVLLNLEKLEQLLDLQNCKATYGTGMRPVDRRVIIVAKRFFSKLRLFQKVFVYSGIIFTEFSVFCSRGRISWVGQIPIDQILQTKFC